MNKARMPIDDTVSIYDELVKSRPMAMEKGPEARYSVWPGVKAYMEYVERPAKHYNAAYGTFYDAINISSTLFNKYVPPSKEKIPENEIFLQDI